MFKAQINHTTGKREWVVQDDKFDVTQELARSRFGDMILDHDRNDKFLAGLKTVISEKKAKGQEAIVLDIGAGTGLLSLMAAREGADRVTAIEVFEPMAVCAKKIINNTPYKNKIEVISSRSTDLESLPDKANIIVAEVFDTELNGEGALRTFKEALTNLAQPGCRVVPSSATVWVTPVSSKFLAKFNDVPRFPYFENRRRNAQDKQLETDTSPLGECPGTAAVFDVQLSELNPRKFTALSRPFIAFEFDYENADKIIYNEKFEREAECINSGTVDAIMMWWSLDMDGTGKHIIDMSPSWCNANKQYTWRDHWMQAVYFPPKKVNLNRGEMFKMNCCHDEYSLWFSFGIEESVPRPYCNCRLHSMYSRYSIHGMNRMVNSASYANFGEEMIAGEFIVVVGEGSLFGLTLARFASKVVIIDINPHSREILTKYISYYNLSDKVELLAEISELKEKPFAVVAEPFYLSATNSFQQLRFWHEAHAIRKIFGEDIEIYPKEANIESLPLEFVDLQKTSLPVGTVHGFDLSYFDKISYSIKRARQATDAIIDEYPLWEYDCYDTANIQRIGKLNFLSEPKDTIIKAELDLGRGTNALALWITWNYDSLLKSTGTHDTKPENGDPVVKDDRIIWYAGMKQCVYLFPPNLYKKEELLATFKYDKTTGNASFSFE